MSGTDLIADVAIFTNQSGGTGGKVDIMILLQSGYGFK